MASQVEQRSGGNEELAWHSAGITHAGAVRRVNEDAFIERPDIGLWGVADGMGGHRAGDTASQAIVEALARFDDQRPLAGRLDQVDDAMEAVNSHLLALRDASTDRAIVGSTVAILVLGEHNLAVALWAGDSRIYRYRDQALEQLSTDHSRVAEYVEQGLIAPEEAQSHSESNVVTRALGSAEDEVLEAGLYDFQAGDRFLLCTDGLNRHMGDDQLARILGHGTPAEVCDRLLDDTLERGGVDNTTVVVVDVTAAGEP